MGSFCQDALAVSTKPTVVAEEASMKAFGASRFTARCYGRDETGLAPLDGYRGIELTNGGLTAR